MTGSRELNSSLALEFAMPMTHLRRQTLIYTYKLMGSLDGWPAELATKFAGPSSFNSFLGDDEELEIRFYPDDLQ